MNRHTKHTYTVNLDKLRLPLVLVVGWLGPLVYGANRALRTEERAIATEKRVDAVEGTQQDQRLANQRFEYLLEQLTRSNKRIERKLRIDE